MRLIFQKDISCILLDVCHKNLVRDAFNRYLTDHMEKIASFRLKSATAAVGIFWMFVKKTFERFVEGWLTFN